jgi:hypothetical protein
MRFDYLGVCSLCSTKIVEHTKSWKHTTSVIRGKGKWLCGGCLVDIMPDCTTATEERNKVMKKIKRKDTTKKYGVVTDPITGKLVKIGEERKL